MLLLSVVFIYTGGSLLVVIIWCFDCTFLGYELNFWSGVYGTAVGKRC